MKIESTRKELLSLPVRRWDDVSTYDSVLILSTGKKHESGYGIITIIGCRGNDAIEIASSCSDDINWSFMYGGRSDCIMPSRAIRFWCLAGYSFDVGNALSSIDIRQVLAEKADE